mmetsp:Transcript_27141/g.37622  ORF Transcript_27141/g.37622 Transcript_27141/m.37622 type:complete len:395 (-) Transcript_27141:46-1230(-)
MSGGNKKEPKLPYQLETYLHPGLLAKKNLEFEMKLGLLIDKMSFRKPDIGIEEGKNKFVQSYPDNCRFESQVEYRVFRSLNKLLNKFCKDGVGTKTPLGVFRKYSRMLCMDAVFKSETGDPVRVSYDLHGSEPPIAVTKEPLPPLLIVWAGQNQLDIRVSAAYEHPADVPVVASSAATSSSTEKTKEEGKKEPGDGEEGEEKKPPSIDSVRVKSRITYQFEYYQVDVTTVFAYPDISSEDGKALTSNCDFRAKLKKGDAVRVFRSSRQEWLPCVVDSVTEKCIVVKFEDNSTKQLARFGPELEKKDHDVLPEVRYEVEVELLPDILTEEESRKRILWKWLQCILLLRSHAMRPSYTPQQVAALQGRPRTGEKRSRSHHSTTTSSNKRGKGEGES